jgi:hypothetical protein
MSQKSEQSMTADQVVDLWKVFGPLPVLSTESLDAYERLASEYAAHYNPTNALQLRFVREAVDADWESFRYSRHRTVTIDRYFRKEAEENVSHLRQKNERRENEIDQINRFGHDDDKKRQLQTLIQATEARVCPFNCVRPIHGG